MIRFKVLYTKQKTQKNKRWADGYLTQGDYGTRVCYLAHESNKKYPYFAFHSNFRVFGIFILLLNFRPIFSVGSIKLYDDDVKLLDSDFKNGKVLI